MKRNIICLFALALALTATAQNTALITKVKSENAKHKTIASSFTQTKYVKITNKNVNSKGMLYYDKTQKMSMIYDQPQGNLLLIAGDKFTMIRGNKRSTFSTKQKSPMTSLRNTLIGSMAGEIQAVADENGATIQSSENGKYYIFTIEKTKGVKGLITKLELQYNKKDCTLDKMRMDEANGDYTIYELTGSKQIDKAIEASKFEVPSTAKK